MQKNLFSMVAAVLRVAGAVFAGEANAAGEGAGERSGRF